ncbi:hypothetical protein [Oribacterium sp. FC2011]|uniref:hypothetical protein n=1 Tax=Oribacterium sp. FC2011 TaxID=1408311 RepID=UPI0004E25A98|nr:hypothetical protein [Oribacterium sp. FC2011]
MIDDIKTSSSGTPFDDVFKTGTEKLSHFLIPIIETMFNVKASTADLEEISRLANEHYLIDEKQNKISKKYSDSCFKIGEKYYHIECQSTEDGSILFRLAEYNVRIALDNAEQNLNSNIVIINLPDSGLINLRGSNNSSKFYHMNIVYKYSNQEILLPVPVMNVSAYSADDIFNNRLFFLIPFYAIRYEKHLMKISDSEDPEYDNIYLELQDYFNRLKDACDKGIISEDDTRKLAELSKIILIHISRNLNTNLSERMVNLVGGQILELQEDRWLKQGREEGRLEGSKSILFSLVMDKIIDISVAAEKAGESESEFIKELEDYINKKKIIDINEKIDRS